MSRPAVLRLLPLALLLLGACAPGARGSATRGPAGDALDASALMELQRTHRVAEIDARRFTHGELWRALDARIGGEGRLRVEEIGRSAEGRPLRAIHFGRGETTVLLWSQMHGDESTATMSLADLVDFLAARPDHPLARRWEERLTVVMVPMLNPDGAERFQRRNAYGVDVNRDARALSTPEGRALKGLRDRLDPEFGFNLHDQNVRTRVGDTGRTAAIALLAPAFDESRSDDPVRARAKRVAAVVRESVEPLVGGHVARYDDTFNPRAFGDLIQKWGTSTVLIESGGWRDDPEKQYLRAVNFVAIASALDAIATGRYATVDPAAYESLPENASPASDLLIAGGRLVVGRLAPAQLDVAVNFEDPLRRTGGRVVDVGDLRDTEARDTVDARGLFVHALPGALRRTGAGPALGPGSPASFILRRGPENDSEPVLRIEDGRVAGGAGEGIRDQG